MPKKGGGGRKAFLKSARPTQEDNEQDVAAQGPPPEIPAKAEDRAETSGHDPSAKFLISEPAGPQSQDSLLEARKDAQSNGKAREEEAKGASTTHIEDETRGQLVQRHKREMKAHKEQMKKLGKKRKDEVERLDREIESRHNDELSAWEAQNADADMSNTSVVAPSSGLYDLTIGDADDKQSKKPTKAQKRREQRAAEEAEREARIAAEKAEIGTDTEKELEEQELAKLLEPQGLTLKEIPADGHCMYRSVQDQLETSEEDPGLDYTELRQETASYMRAFPDNFLPFINQDEKSGKEADQLFEEYCDTVEETAAWGGQVELQALAQAIERHIVVHCAGLPLVEMGTEYKGKHPPLQICYLRHAFTLGEHYNSVQAVKS